MENPEILITYAAIIAMAVLPIYVGSFASLKQRGVRLSKKNEKFEYSVDFQVRFFYRLFENFNVLGRGDVFRGRLEISSLWKRNSLWFVSAI